MLNKLKTPLEIAHEAIENYQDSIGLSHPNTDNADEVLTMLENMEGEESCFDLAEHIQTQNDGATEAAADWRAER